MDNLDSWVNSVIKQIGKEVNEEVKTEVKKVLSVYADMFYESITRKWDNYLESYTPGIYERTGMTRAGIIVDPRPRVNFDGSLEVSVEFIDSFMIRHDKLTDGERHVFKAMNDGWGDKSLRKGDKFYRFAGFEGLHILEEAEYEIKRLLPDYVDLKIKWSGD